MATAPSTAAGWLRVVVAMPRALKPSVVAPRVPALVASVAVWPLASRYGLVQGLLPSAQAVTVTVVGRQLMPVAGRESS